MYTFAYLTQLQGTHPKCSALSWVQGKITRPVSPHRAYSLKRANTPEGTLGPCVLAGLLGKSAGFPPRPVWLSWLEYRPVNRKVTGLIPSQGTYLGCRFSAGSGHIWKQLMFLTLMLLSLPPSPSLQACPQVRIKIIIYVFNCELSAGWCPRVILQKEWPPQLRTESQAVWRPWS